jgi:hypothetical protein
MAARADIKLAKLEVRSGIKRLPNWLHERLITATASWLTQSTGNNTMSARLMRPGSKAALCSTPAS